MWNLISQMTLDEKLSFVEGSVDPQGLGEAGYIPGVPRLGIPPLRLTDSPDGVRLTGGTATAMPAPVALAAAFDPGLAATYGRTIGTEARALQQDVLLGPMVNIIRVPQGGRNFEAFSEDPLVNATTAAAEITGIQSAGEIATVKHFAANNQENNRTAVDANIDEQTLHQVELPAYQAAVEAGVGAVMCSYNSVNGTHSCSNTDLLNSILKTQWQFNGWVVSDWGATHATTDILAGLDQDMYNIGSQSNTYFSSDLKTAITNSTIPESALDNSVARILGEMQRFGLLDGAATRRPALNLAADALTAQSVAEQGAVLLKNSGNALPLTGSSGSIALIGPAAATAKVDGGGSAAVTPPSAESPLAAITSRAGSSASVQYVPGLDTTGVAIPATALSPAPSFDTSGATLQPGQTIFYGGTITVPTSDTYTFSIATPLGYGALAIDGTPIATSIEDTQNGSIQLTAGVHSITFFATPLTSAPITVHLNWITPDMAATARAAAVAVAKTVQTPIVFASDDETEGSDRANLTLPADQDKLIAAVAAANPNTIVVLDVGSAVTMPWLGNVKAVLDMWYPGENGAQATAALLYGDVNPSGRVTQTFPASDSVTPIAGNPNAYPGVNNEEAYSEGIYVGYKWYDKTGNTPLFPFGYGLSYTTFAFSHLHANSGPHPSVEFTVTNTGNRAGQEVAQVYVGPSPNVTEPQAVRQLVAYAKVSLRPGESRRVIIQIDPQQLSYWNISTHAWALGTGTRSLWVGSSSADLPLQATITVRN